MQLEILHELHTTDRLRDVLDDVETILGFLSSNGGNPEMLIEEFITDVLKLQRTFTKVKQV